ncbi:response regulator [Rhizobium sp. LC145]|uniref:response regulator n=1 Tax=Rhizobium sp. LC145 TaxID=1120688 RepID=UPI00069C0C1E|nr:response regulator [Rhizobium sp. LC145]TKT68756.1 response regulator [Rhizobiaceae bacterium LC148]
MEFAEKQLDTQILLVDDEEPLLEITSSILTDAGHKCLLAPNASEALRQLENNAAIAVVVSDIRMPEMDGISLLQAIRSRFADRDWLQVLFVTGHATLDIAVEALRLDAVDFLHKPIRRDELLEAVGRAIMRSNAQRRRRSGRDDWPYSLDKLSEEVRRLGTLLQGTDTKGSAASAARTENPPDAKTDTQRLLTLIRTRQLREKMFNDELFADPVWQMLLYLLEYQLQNDVIYLTNLYMASGVPISTASRRLLELEQAGLVRRVNDPADGRRQIVALTPEAMQRLVGYFEMLDKKLSEQGA